MAKKVIGINGSPRKDWNTYQLVCHALKGADEKGAETELVNLYDLTFKGCISCFQCKKKGGPSFGHCGYKDELKPLLDKIDSCDGLIIGSPIYFGDVTASTRAFIERLFFQYLTYRGDNSTFFTRSLPTLFIYTMNCPENVLEKIGYMDKFESYSKMSQMLLKGKSQFMYVTETLQTERYEDYEMSMFDVEARKKRHELDFPLDVCGAHDMGGDLLR